MEADEREQHAAREARPEADPVSGSEISREARAGARLANMGRAEGPQLFGEQRFDAFRADGEEAKRRIGDGRAQGRRSRAHGGAARGSRLQREVLRGEGRRRRG